MMTMTSIGDLAGSFTGRLNMLRVKGDLLRLNGELATGRPADPVAHLGGDTARVGVIDRDIEIARARATAATGLGQILATMQVVMGDIDTLRGNLSEQLLAVTPASSPIEITRASEAGAETFRDIVARLGASQGGTLLFAGVATDTPPLADADAMLASLSAAAAGAVTAEDVIDAVNTWFDDPAGGFATMGYLGDDGAPLSRRIDDDATVTISARADHPAVKELLRTTAILALAADPALALEHSSAVTLVQGTLPDMIAAATPLTDLRAEIGLAEARTAEAATRHGAQAAALTIMRNELALVDPYATAVALKETETQLETQFLLTSRLSGLSLVNFLK